MKTFLFAFVLTVFCFTDANFAQENPVKKQFRFKGVVTDKNAAVFAEIPLFFNGNGQEIIVSTDINGEFLIELLPGSYEITVRKTISETFKAYVTIQENGLNPNNVEFVIEPSPVCCNAAGEKPYPKIIKLPKPAYPPAAMAIRAGGEVVVDLKIDQAGKVISATAISGHPLLRAVSVQAAKQILFESSENDIERQAKLTYVYLMSQNEKINLKHYSNLYRLEIISLVTPILNTTGE